MILSLAHCWNSKHCRTRNNTASLVWAVCNDITDSQKYDLDIVQVEGMLLVIDDLVGSTGLELKVDPGVPYVYAGFAGMPKHQHPLLVSPSDPNQLSTCCAFQLYSTLVLLLMWSANTPNKCFVA